MEVKLVESPVWKRSAIMWFVFSAFLFWGAIDYDSIYLLVSGMLGVVQGVYFLTKMTNLTYLTLHNDILTIHLRKLPFGKRKIKLSEINKGEVLGKELLLYLHNGRVIKLRNDWISYDSFSNLKKELESHSIPVR